MTVKITKPELNIREELNKANKSTGVAGEALLRANTFAEQQALLGVGRRNLLINGDFRVSQRGDFTGGLTSPAGVTTYSADRWQNRAYSSDNQTITHTKNVLLPNGIYTNTLRVTQTGTVNDGTFWHMIQSIELDRAAFAGRYVTFSYWYRTNSEWIQPRFCDGYTCRAIDYNLIPDGQWHFATWTSYFDPNIVNVASTAVAQFHPAFAKASGGSINGGEYFEWALAQGELGTVATPFEYRSYGEELALCQRYYIRYTGDTDQVYLNGAYWSGDHYCSLQFPTTMRAAPTFSITSTTSLRTFSWGSSSQATNVTLGGISRKHAEIIVASGRTNDAVFVRFNASSDWLAFDAEL